MTKIAGAESEYLVRGSDPDRIRTKMSGIRNAGALSPYH
jgi:hypothetical protein